MIGRLTSDLTNHRAARMFVAALIVCGLTAFTGASAKDAASDVRVPSAAAVADKLVGTWHLRSSALRDQSGAIIGPAYQDPAGKLIYTRRGEMWVVAGNRGAPLWYTGRFEVRPRINTIVHHVQYSTILAWEGTAQLRKYRFLSPNLLRLRVLVGTTTLELIWKRS